MEDIGSVVARFGDRAPEIRRRFFGDARFRDVCADYEEAARALRYWREKAKDGERKAAEYAALLDQLGGEILARLAQPADGGAVPGPDRRE